MREFLRPDDVRDLVADQFGRPLTGLDRLTGGSKKGVYRLTLDDGSTTMLYVWAAGENYWPPGPAVPDDPFTDASVADLFAAAHAALTAAGARVPRERIADHVRALRAAVLPRTAYGLVHGELGPDHVLVTPAGEPVLIDIEGLTWFDVEWEHAWLRMRFADAYPALEVPGLDPDRLELYRYAQVLSLIEGPLRIAGTDFPEREWMLELAEWNITQALAGPRA
jgi:phosphotransferase family enzyme